MTYMCPVLKFGTAFFQFCNKKQMKAFVENWCYMDKRGKVILHHGLQCHVFTELCREFYKYLPSDLRFVRKRKTAFMRGIASEYGKIKEDEGYETRED